MNWKANFAVTSLYIAAFGLLYTMFLSYMTESVIKGNHHLGKANSIQTAMVTVNPQARSELYSAIGEYNKVLLLDRENVSVLNNRAGAFYRLGSYKLAVDDLNTCIRLEPSEWYHYYVRGKCLERLGNREAAWLDYNQSMSLASMEVSPCAAYLVSRACNEFIKNRPAQNIASQPKRTF